MIIRKLRHVIIVYCLVSSLAVVLSLAAAAAARQQFNVVVNETESVRTSPSKRPDVTSPPRKIRRRANIDLLYSNEEDDDTIEIDPAEQDRLLVEANKNCTLRRIEALRAAAASNSSSLKKSDDTCPIIWDAIICWPELAVNQSYSLPCPNYVNKFNRRKKAVKFCVYNETTKMPSWSRTNFTMCLQPSEHIIEDMSEIKILENHLKYIMVIRLCGYLISIVSLVFSMIILLRPKMRCPRNNVHVNLFLTFCLRTILILTVDILNAQTSIFKISSSSSSTTTTKSTPTPTPIPSSSSSSSLTKMVDNDKSYSICRSVITIFRYSGSVYHTAITTEAIYLMLLLRFPYYSEKKGSKFCIIASWILPVVWILPWIFIRVFVESQWCWQVESLWNLLIEIPHTILTIINVTSAVYIICTLYSKMQRHDLNPEKVIKYRRLAKSILILVPIFGLHFIFFEWLPYVRAVNDDESLLELPLMYMEALFNSFQGLLASIACCFIHLEARIEMLIMTRRLLKRFKLLNTFERLKCLRAEYITKLRNSREPNGRGRGAEANNLLGPHKRKQRSMSVSTTAVAGATATANVKTPLLYGGLLDADMATPSIANGGGSSMLNASNGHAPMMTTPITSSKTSRRSTMAGDMLATESLLGKSKSASKASVNAQRQQSTSSASASAASTSRHRHASEDDSYVRLWHLFSCLFGTQKNDFYAVPNSSRRRSVSSISSIESSWRRHWQRRKSRQSRESTDYMNPIDEEAATAAALASSSSTPVNTTSTSANSGGDLPKEKSTLARFIDTSRSHNKWLDYYNRKRNRADRLAVLNKQQQQPTDTIMFETINSDDKSKGSNTNALEVRFLNSQGEILKSDKINGPDEDLKNSI